MEEVDKGRQEFENLLKRDTRYPGEAYEFINHYISKNGDVTASELVDKIITEMKDKYSCLGGLLMENLGIRSVSDIGNIVYYLIDLGQANASENDSRGDFEGIYGDKQISEFFSHAPTIHYNHETGKLSASL